MSIKRSTRSNKIPVYQEPESSHSQEPPKKRKRGDSKATDTTPPPRRALREKNPNPSSSDTSAFKDTSTKKPPTKRTPAGGRTPSLLQNESFQPPPTEDEFTKHASPGRRELEKIFPPQEVDEIYRLLNRGAAQDAADLITATQAWSPDLIDIFRETTITKLDLSLPKWSSPGRFPSGVESTRWLQVLFQQNCFASLTTLALREHPLNDDDVALLRLLPALASLNLHRTGISTEALHHLVCHRHTLQSLNIAENPGIKDAARIILSALYKLNTLYLRGTAFSMTNLRLLVTELPKNCRIRSIPTPCLEYLNQRDEHYAVEIPAGYMSDPRQVDYMQLPTLKKNLELHAKANKRIQVTGNKADLVVRLKQILANREMDAKVVMAVRAEDP